MVRFWHKFSPDIKLIFKLYYKFIVIHIWHYFLYFIHLTNRSTFILFILLYYTRSFNFKQVSLDKFHFTYGKNSKIDLKLSDLKSIEEEGGELDWKKKKVSWVHFSRQNHVIHRNLVIKNTWLSKISGYQHHPGSTPCRLEKNITK